MAKSRGGKGIPTTGDRDDTKHQHRGPAFALLTDLAYFGFLHVSSLYYIGTATAWPLPETNGRSNSGRVRRRHGDNVRGTPADGYRVGRRPTPRNEGTGSPAGSRRRDHRKRKEMACAAYLFLCFFTRWKWDCWTNVFGAVGVHARDDRQTYIRSRPRRGEPCRSMYHASYGMMVRMWNENDLVRTMFALYLDVTCLP